MTINYIDHRGRYMTYNPLNLFYTGNSFVSKLEQKIREGFPNCAPEQFVQMLVDHYRVAPDKTVNRIEYKYVDEASKS